MQKLVERDTCTPTDAPLVRGNCDLPLNREETLSVSDLKTSSNNPEVDYPSIQGVLKTFVYVLSKDGNPLMPCSKAKARKLLKEGKAYIAGHKPFTIRLNFDCENKVQKITLGIDPGYENIGLSAISEKKELFSAKVKLRTDICKLLTEKRMYRRGRRNKLWYRKPRFSNRKRKEKILPPSIKCKLNAHLKIVKKICSFLPIQKINLEIAIFDIQKIQNPEIAGVQYQKGNLYEYENLKSYLTCREGAKCQLCGKKSTKGNSFRIHHIIPRKNGGTNKPNNLSLLHEKCHKKLHRKNLHHLLKKNKQFKSETFMSTINWKLFEELKNICGNISFSFGYVTKIRRQALKLEKDHHTDAYVIAGGSTQERVEPYIFQKKEKKQPLFAVE